MLRVYHLAAKIEDKKKNSFHTIWNESLPLLFLFIKCDATLADPPSMQHGNKGLVCIHGSVAGYVIKGTDNWPERVNGHLCILKEL